MSKKYVHMIYPEDRVVNPLQVIQWAQDLIANEIGLSDFPDVTLKQAMLLLEHYGKCTFTQNYESRPGRMRVATTDGSGRGEEY